MNNEALARTVYQQMFPPAPDRVSILERAFEEAGRYAAKQEREAKDGAYLERNRLVALLAALYPSSMEPHPDDGRPWDAEWRWIIFVDLPTGQATWHIHDSHHALFAHVPRHQGRAWDGHSTEEKYERVAALCAK